MLRKWLFRTNGDVEEWCDTVGRLVASDPKSPPFKSGQKQFLFEQLSMLSTLPKSKIRQYALGRGADLVVRELNFNSDNPSSDPT